MLNGLQQARGMDNTEPIHPLDAADIEIDLDAATGSPEPVPESPAPSDPPRAPERRASGWEYQASSPFPATFNGESVGLRKIERRTVTFESSTAYESDIEGTFLLRVDGLFPEMSRMRGRVLDSESHDNGFVTNLEITDNPVYLSFAATALHALNERGAGSPSEAAPRDIPPPERRRHVVPSQKPADAPVPTIPSHTLVAQSPVFARFGEIRVSVLEVTRNIIRASHAEKIPLHTEDGFVLQNADGTSDSSKSRARVVALDLSGSATRKLYVTTLEITGNLLGYSYGIDGLVSAGKLRPKVAEHSSASSRRHADRPALVPTASLTRRPSKSANTPEPASRKWTVSDIALIALILLCIVGGAIAMANSRQPASTRETVSRVHDAPAAGSSSPADRSATP